MTQSAELRVFQWETPPNDGIGRTDFLTFEPIFLQFSKSEKNYKKYYERSF